MTVAQKSKILETFEAQRAYQYEVANTGYRERIAKLKALRNAVENTYRQEIRDALYADLRKPQAESDLSEIFAVTTEINHAIKNLRSWTSKRYVSTPLAFIGSSSYIQYQPKGVCLIISPWNFPLNLTVGPLVSAIAAGNTVIIKPSEHTPHTTTVLKKMVNDLFDPREVEVIEGAVEEATELLSLPFNHIFFTGSPQVGKIVMRAAAEHLTSVTLELGGKSPTIIDETANIKSTVRRIAWGKFLNAGQICIAPDYIYVHESKKEEFVNEMKSVLTEFYDKNPNDSPSYCSLVNQNHAGRVNAMLEDALEKGAEVVFGGEVDLEAKLISPTIITDVPLDAMVMQEEIFGPLLPILTYKEKEEVINHINGGEKPLALYVYSKQQKNIDYFIDNTRAGGTCINNNTMHFLHPNLPFGGDNNSGIGKAHGFWGFQAFSNERSVYRQVIPSVIEKLMPPYTDGKNKIVEWIVKLF